MWKGNYGIPGNTSHPNITIRPKAKKQRLKKENALTKIEAFSLQKYRDNA